jgi:integrase
VIDTDGHCSLGEIFLLKNGSSIFQARSTARRFQTYQGQTRKDTKKLLESILRDDLAGLRDRALVSTMLFSLPALVRCCLSSGKISITRDSGVGYGSGKEHEMPAHRGIEEAIDEYLSKVIIEDNQPLFQSVNKAGTALSGRALNRHNAWAAIRKRARNAGFLTPVGCHTWRATGVTVYLENGGWLYSCPADGCA